MQILEVVVVAASWGDAIELLKSVGIDEKSKKQHRPINGLFIVRAEKANSLTEEEYTTIRDTPELALLSDSLSRERVGDVLDKVYEVEVELRKLLLHVYDLIDRFFDVFRESKYTKDFTNSKSVARKGSLNPITSHLTLGEMQAILGIDLSWSGKAPISIQEIGDLLTSAADFDNFKGEFSKKIKVNTVWDVIAENVLKSKTSWSDIYNDLKTLKRFRDESAHYQVITEKKKDELIEKADSLIKKITPTRTATKKDYENIYYASKALSDVFVNFQAKNTLFYKQLVDIKSPLEDTIETIKKLNLTVTGDYSKGLAEIQPGLNAYSSLFKDINTPWIVSNHNDDDNDKKDEDEKEDNSKAIAKK
jgi:hypothetical protein